MVGMRARRSWLLTSQRLLRCASAHSTRDCAGVYPRLSKSRIVIIFPLCATASAPSHFVPHTSVWRLREKDNVADLRRGVAFSSGDAGPLHSILPHPLADTLPTLSLAGLDGKTTDLGPSASVGNWKLHGTYSKLLSFPLTPYMSGCTGRCTHTKNRLSVTWRVRYDVLYCSLGGLGRGFQVH